MVHFTIHVTTLQMCAPEHMRGRYMAVSGLSWSISFTVGPYFAGLILDSANPNLLWAFCGIIGMLAAVGFTVLNKVNATGSTTVEAAATD